MCVAFVHCSYETSQTVCNSWILIVGYVFCVYILYEEKKEKNYPWMKNLPYVCCIFDQAQTHSFNFGTIVSCICSKCPKLYSILLFIGNIMFGGRIQCYIIIHCKKLNDRHRQIKISILWNSVMRYLSACLCFSLAQFALMWLHSHSNTVTCTENKIQKRRQLIFTIRSKRARTHRLHIHLFFSFTLNQNVQFCTAGKQFSKSCGWHFCICRCIRF